MPLLSAMSRLSAMMSRRNGFSLLALPDSAILHFMMVLAEADPKAA